MVRAPKSTEAKRSESGAQPRDQGPVPMEAVQTPQPSAAEPQPVKPKFAPLSAYEQSGKRLEFRRVSRCVDSVQQEKSCWSLQSMHAESCSK